MALTNIEYGSIASSKVLNDNFNYLEDKIEDYSKNIASDKASLISLINSQISTTFTQLNTKITETIQALYPVGSTYIGSTDTCPIANLFGTWEKVAEGLVVDIDSNIAIKGNGKTLGFSDGNDGYGMSLTGNTENYGILHTYDYNQSIPSNNTTGWGSGIPRASARIGITQDSSKSGLVGVANTTKLEVNIWRRTA